MKKSKPIMTNDAIKILHRRFVDGRPEMEALLEEARASAQLARMIHDMRQEAGLTQRALAKLVRTTPSVISRLEDADYQGHSLGMLRRIAGALKRRVEVRIVPVPRRGRAA